jgi:hypothetical protein
MKIAVIGSRDFERLDLVIELVDSLPLRAIVVSGGARGVDRTARTAAEKRGLICKDVPADWDELGPRAGQERNGEIVGQADEVWAFLAPCRQAKCAVGRCPGRGWTHGTMDAIVKARAAQKVLTVVLESGARRVFGPGVGIPDFGASGL